MDNTMVITEIAGAAGTYKVTLDPGVRPEAPKGWAVFQVGPALDVAPKTRNVRRRGPNRNGTVAAMAVDIYPDHWLVYDPYRVTIHSIEEVPYRMPVGAIPADANYGISVKVYRSALAARLARYLDRRDARRAARGAATAPVATAPVPYAAPQPLAA